MSKDGSPRPFSVSREEYRRNWDAIDWGDSLGDTIDELTVVVTSADARMLGTMTIVAQTDAPTEMEVGEHVGRLVASALGEPYEAWTAKRVDSSEDGNK